VEQAGMSEMQPLRIGLNLLHARPEIGGGWNYMQHLLIGLAEVDDNNQYVCYATDESHALIPKRPNFLMRRIAPHFRSRLKRVLYENVALPVVARRDRLDMLHWFANADALFPSVPGLITIHDLLVFKQPSAFGAIQRNYMRLWMTRSARTSARLLPVSQYTAQDLKITFGVESERMSVVYAALPEVFHPSEPSLIERVRSNYGLPQRFWLYVAQSYPHKNHLALLDAYADFRRQHSDAWPLVLRGDFSNRSDVTEKISDLGLKSEVIVLGRLPIDDMPALYGAAGALIFPSLFEGGGIPVLEALACGCAVAASDLPSVREYGGEAIHYLNPQSTQSIVDALHALQSQPALRASLAGLGLKRVTAFRSESVGCKMVEIYGEVGAQTK
jgi:glycosyltransferase involved in cell wall biosynthesis